jgi:hypothetical protein
MKNQTLIIECCSDNSILLRARALVVLHLFLHRLAEQGTLLLLSGHQASTLSDGLLYCMNFNSVWVIGGKCDHVLAGGFV